MRGLNELFAKESAVKGPEVRILLLPLSGGGTSGRSELLIRVPSATGRSADGLAGSNPVLPVAFWLFS